MSFRLAECKYSTVTKFCSYRIILFCLLGVIVGFGLLWWYCHCVPLCNQAYAQRSAFQNSSNQHDELAEKIQKSSSCLYQKQNLGRELLTFVASGKTLQSSLDTLVESMQKTGLVCAHIKPVPEKIKIKPAYKSTVVEMQARGSFKKIYNFLLSLPSLYLCHFKKISLSKDGRKRLCLNAQLKVFLSHEATT